MSIYTDFNSINKTYDIIYTDPPWQYGGSGGTKWSPASCYYKTMSFKELAALDMNSISKDNCLLFMWVASPIIPQAISLASSWGFKYITVAFVWHKRRANVGNYTMSGCELCLLFKHGKIPQGRVRRPGVKQFYEEKITTHSTKPHEFRKRIEQMFPIADRIELFGRQTTIGWDVFGDEVRT